MTSAELRDFISLGEGFTIEFKRSLTTSISRELCAFANSSGGYIFIGVEDSGVICGVRKHNKLKSELQSIARSFDPALIIDVGSVDTDKNWVTVTFPRDPAKAGIPEKTEGPVKGPVGGPVKGPVSLSVLKRKILFQCEKADSSRDELLKVLDMKVSGYFKRSLRELIKNVYLEYTLPEKPGSRLQKYRLTKKGKSLIEELDKTKRKDTNERV